MTSQWDGVASRLGGRDQAMHRQLCNSTAAASHPLRVCCTRKHVNQQLAFAGASLLLLTSRMTWQAGHYSFWAVISQEGRAALELDELGFPSWLQHSIGSSSDCCTVPSLEPSYWVCERKGSDSLGEAGGSRGCTISRVNCCCWWQGPRTIWSAEKRGRDGEALFWGSSLDQLIYRG